MADWVVGVLMIVLGFYTMFKVRAGQQSPVAPREAHQRRDG